MRDPLERLRDILEAISAIERHADQGKVAFERLVVGKVPRNDGPP